MNRMRILHVIPDLRKGGAERLVLDICHELAGHDVQVTLMNFSQDNDYERLSAGISRKVIPARFVPSVWRKPDKNLRGYENFLREFKPHIIHSHLFIAEMVTRQVLLEGTAYVTHLHDNMPQFMNFSAAALLNKLRLTNYYEKRLIVRQYRKCRNNFIAISKHTADYFKQCLPADLRGRITILHNAINFGRFCSAEKKLLREPYRLVTTGALVDKKNQIFLVDVMKLLMEKGLRVNLDILGDGPNRQKIQQQIDEAGLNDRITIQGNVERVEDYLHRAHVYVHPALYEPFGLAILEAMAAGLPCVMLDGKGNRDIAEDGKNGFLVEQISPSAFAERIVRLINAPQLYDEMSAYAVNFARKYDMKAYAVRLLGYYDSILGKSF